MASRALLAPLLPVVAFASALLVPGCGGAPSQVSFVSQERPDNSGETSVRLHSEPGGERELPSDSEVVEPEHPLVGTKSERALVHIHTPDGVCSGAVVGTSTVVTAQQCIKGFPAGANIVPEGRDFHVEVASSSLTWTQRKVKKIVLPSCEWADLDVAALSSSPPSSGSFRSLSAPCPAPAPRSRRSASARVPVSRAPRSRTKAAS
jgi:hypothetical protein